MSQTKDIPLCKGSIALNNCCDDCARCVIEARNILKHWGSISLKSIPMHHLDAISKSQTILILHHGSFNKFLKEEFGATRGPT